MENNFEINHLKKIFYDEFIKNNVLLNEKFIIGVSGGPDSMWILNLMKDLDIVVAVVNYNKRKDSWKDQQIVEKFCLKNNIKCEVLILDKNQKYDGNFQKIARDQRYQFYKKLYNKYAATKLILAHHKDDALETYLFQKNSKRKPKLYGINILNNLLDMNIFRPMINLWFKDEILDMVNYFEIPYAIDYTNNLPVYTRNKIRLELQDILRDEKDKLFEELININSQLSLKNKEVEKEYLDFRNTNFSYKKLNLDHCYINEILFEFIHKNIADAKVCKNKLNSFKKFIQSEKNYKSFKINDKNFILKDHGTLKIDKK